MNTSTKVLTPRQTTFLEAYTESASDSFGNCYKSAIKAGYSDLTARNFTAKRTGWMSDFVGEMAISPEQIMTTLTGIINDDSEPTIIKLKAIEMTMKAYNMMSQHRPTQPQAVVLNVDLTNSSQ